MLFFFNARSVSASSSGLSSTSRITFSSMVPSLIEPISLQRKIKSCAFFDGAFRPNFSAVPADDSLHGGKADARPGKFGHRVKALKRAEQPVGIARIEPRAVVP